MRVAITAFVLFLLSIAAAAQNFDKASRQAIAAWQFPALAVAVVQDDKVVFLEAYGVKELGKPDPVSVDTLYFGTAKPDHSVVTAAEWQKFLGDEVTPRFEGFTHWEAHGSWKGESEESHVLQIVHAAGREDAVAAIIDAYKKRFAQEAVLQVRSDVWLRVR